MQFRRTRQPAATAYANHAMRRIVTRASGRQRDASVVPRKRGEHAAPQRAPDAAPTYHAFAMRVQAARNMRLHMARKCDSLYEMRFCKTHRRL